MKYLPKYTMCFFFRTCYKPSSVYCDIEYLRIIILKNEFKITCTGIFYEEIYLKDTTFDVVYYILFRHNYIFSLFPISIGYNNVFKKGYYCGRKF